MIISANYNYDGAGSNLTNDLALLSKYTNAIRFWIPDYTNGTAITTWRTYVQQALNSGFSRVIWGVSSNPTVLTATNFSTFKTAILAEGTWCQAQNNVALELNIGNEEELHHDGSLTDAQVEGSILAIGTAAGTAYTVGKRSYVANQAHINDYVALGKGNLNYIGFNIYDDNGFFATNLNTAYSTFGTAMYIGEFAPNSHGRLNVQMTDENWAINLKKMFYTAGTRGILSAFVYNYMDPQNIFGVKNNNGTDYNMGFQTLFLQNRRSYSNIPNQYGG